MKSAEIRSRFLAFFRKRGHAIIPSASLVTTDEKGVTNPTLFNTAGMQPLVPYLLGKPHPQGTRLVDIQKCLRTVDIDDIGDKTHATFFEMLGNWSLGDYFKKEAIAWSYEFLTSNEEGLGLDPRKLYVTVFEGDENAPRDEEAAAIWREIFVAKGIEGERIFYLGSDSNWWPAVKGKDEWNGPTGPCTEMFYDISDSFDGEGMTQEEFLKAGNEGHLVEIWNDVFMEFEKVAGRIQNKLKKPNVDTGAGLERIAAVLQGVNNIFETDLFAPIMAVTKKLGDGIEKQRVIADHIRAGVFLIADGVTPSNTDRGYILRRLIRRAVFKTNNHNLGGEEIDKLVDAVLKIYADSYPELDNKRNNIVRVLNDEATKFSGTLEHGLKEFERLFSQKGEMDAKDAFTLFSSYGLPIDLIIDASKARGTSIDRSEFEDEFRKHQELSRMGAEQKFKGGLADTSEMSVRYHTATHLLHQALHDVLGEGVTQKGSNITPERLRFDFSFPNKMTDEQKKMVEEVVNQKISAGLPVNQVMMPREQAERTGARHFFGEKYEDQVSVYYIGFALDTAYSKEFCGGPHVGNTRDLAGPDGKAKFRIRKEEAISQGVRRIRAVLE